MIPPLLLAGLAAGAVARLRCVLSVGVAFALAGGSSLGAGPQPGHFLRWGLAWRGQLVVGWAIGLAFRCISTGSRFAAR